MPRFFFDITDGATTIDDAGTDLPNAHAARDAAIKVLPDIARDEIGKRQSREVSVLMRDVDGRALFTASLTLTARWLVDTA
jgi:hypothetical protein